MFDRVAGDDDDDSDDTMITGSRFMAIKIQFFA